MLFYHNRAIVKLLQDNYTVINGVMMCHVVEVKKFYRSTVFYDYLVDRNALQPIVTDNYKLGDLISLKEGDYVGVITGFEEAENNVVSKPYNEVVPQLRHVRYVHNASLVELHSPTDVIFRPGKHYLINDSIKVVAFYNQQVENGINLVNKNFTIEYTCVPKQASIFELNKFGIRSVKPITHKEWAK